MSLFSRIKSLFGANKCQHTETNPSLDDKQPVLSESQAEDQSAQRELTAIDYFTMAYEEYGRQEIPQAMEHFIKAADMGENNAQSMLGLIYWQGIPGVPADKHEAERRLRQAAEWGNPEAQFNLGFMHIRGEAPTPNLPEALTWVEKAAAQRYPKAIQLLTFLEQQGLIHRP